MTVTCLGQDGHDLVGPSAAQGPDGIEDLHLQLAGLAGAVDQFWCRPPAASRGRRSPTPRVSLSRSIFPSTISGQGDLYFNPQVNSDLASTGGPLPWGGSTG